MVDFIEIAQTEKRECVYIEAIQTKNQTVNRIKGMFATKA